MTSQQKPRRLKRSVIATLVILVCVIVLFLLKGCSGCANPTNNQSSEPTPIAGNEEESILQIMKRDETYLLGLYDAPNICEKEWIQEYRSIGKTFQSYEYHGQDEEIKELIKSYSYYGKKIEEIAIVIDENNYEEGIKQLEDLKEIAKENEKELGRLYEKEFSDKAN
ncbi:MAG: hypothetical protein J6D29_07915 [Solobacterium sp.]|nr:hypothetical protein [Solobacterium sp.]